MLDCGRYTSLCIVERDCLHGQPRWEGDDDFSRVGAVKLYECDYRYEPENFDPSRPAFQGH